MPVVPKSPPSAVASAASNGKRAGAPKAKGAVRAKSGCYTCRIRRKKCDEQPNDQGHCSTCVRLRLECLGFGAKRPDWLRENRNVLQLRDKIKNFLASQGMIKGHSGSGARSSEQPNVLRLTLTDAETPPYHSGSSSSPPTRSQTLSNDEYSSSRRHHPTSHTRGSGWVTNHMDQSYPHGNGHYAPNSEYHRSTSPQSIDGYPHPLSPPSLVQSFNRRHNNNRYHPYGEYPQRQNNQQVTPYQDNWTPAKMSYLAPSYNWDMTTDFPAFFPDDQYNQHTYMADGACPGELISPAATAGTYSFPPYLDAFRLPTAELVNLLVSYKTEVVTVQYLLSTIYIRNHIVSTIPNEQTVREPTSEQQAAALLSLVFSRRFARPANELVLQTPDIRLHLHDIERAINKRNLSAEDAMAALHLVSVVLFDGGHGKWQQYLVTAADYVRSRMRGLSQNMNGLEELRKLSEKEAFIVKTAIWFDVIASVTTRHKPFLLDTVKLLFKPDQSRLEELSSGVGPAAYRDYRNPDEEKASMMSPMGCQNKVLWALAETSALAAWKKEQKARGRLSVKDLVSRGAQIEKELQVRYHHTVKILDDFDRDPVVYSRYLASHIFRASAMLYLDTVVSDGYPHVPQIKLSVDEVMRWIRRIPKKPQMEVDKTIHKAVVRSTVFAFYITGAMTDDVRYRKEVQEYLLVEAAEETVGNVQITAKLLSDIWEERNSSRDSAVEVLWRERLDQNEDPILLV